ncbi:MAG: pentapeptide repeat-containing protein [Leptolyngbyaceae cyanobacterium]
MKGYYLVAIPLLSTLILGAPSLAEAPENSVVNDMRAINIQRLAVTNRCDYCDLVGVDLSSSRLIRANLRGAVLIGADLSWSNLEGADLTGADLTGADLTGAFLTNASLANADLDNVNFSQAILHDVDVAGASMENLNLAGATIEGTGISIGGSADPLEAPGDDGDGLPILTPEEQQQLSPPGNPWYIPGYPTDELLDIPQQIVPQV